MDISLSGIIAVSGAVEAPVSGPAFAPRVAPDVTSPVHQHLFSLVCFSHCFLLGTFQKSLIDDSRGPRLQRLNWELDGGTNTLSEECVEALPMDAANAAGTQFAVVKRTLETEAEVRAEQSFSILSSNAFVSGGRIYSPASPGCAHN